jgi:LysR family transcriptional regulator, low CO2-responsive transcriptional regulator
MSMNAAQLRAFHAVASTGKFTTAARSLSVTQPTLSNQVARLEAHYQVRLFDRTPRGVKLTPVGERLYELSKRHFALANEADQLLSASGTLTGGFIRVGSDGPHHVMPVLAELARINPDVQVSVQMGNAATILVRLADAHLDVAIVGRDLSDPRYHFEAFNHSALVCFVALAHPLAGRRSITLAELLKFRLVLREAQSHTRQIFAQSLEARGLEIARMFEVESREAVREAVAAGLGVGIVSGAELDPDPRVQRIEITDLDIVMTQYVAFLREHGRLSVIQAFCAAARSLSIGLGE